MKKTLLSTLVISLFVFGFNFLFGQCPSNPDVSLHSQAEVNDYLNNYSNCTELGELSFEPAEEESETDINDISGFTSLITVGRLNIYHTQLVDLTGLNNVETINGGLDVYGNTLLESLFKLESLVTIEDFVTIYENPTLSDCSIEAICNFTGGETGFGENEYGCSTEEEVQEGCNANNCEDFGTDVATTASCYGECTGTITLSPFGGAEPYYYDWGEGQTEDNSQSDLCAGDYTITVTDDIGCELLVEVTVSENPEIIASITIDEEILCNGDCNGSLIANASGGTSPYSYEWDNGEDSQSIEDLCAGTYTVTVTDDIGCTATAQYTLTQPDVLSLSETHINVSCNGGDDGSIDLSVSDGTPDYSFSWSNDETTEDISGLEAGSYTVTVTDFNYCYDILTVEITEPDEILVEIEKEDETGIDFNDGSATANPTGGTPPYTYAWNNGELTKTIENLSPGDYTLTVTDKNNCESTGVVTIQKFICLDLTANAEQTNVNCYNSCDGEIEITWVDNAVEPLDYEWDNEKTTAMISDLCPGTYTVTITDDKKCEVKQSYTITQPTELLANGSSTDETANNANDGTATVNPMGGVSPYSYYWSNGKITQSISSLSPNNYSVTITDSNGCLAIYSTTVGAFGCQEFYVPVSQSDVSCNGGNDGSLNGLDINYIVINEVMYHTIGDGIVFDYIELFNFSDDTIQMQNFELSVKIEHIFDDYEFPPFSYLVLGKDSTLIKNTDLDVIVWDNNFESNYNYILLSDNSGKVIDSVYFKKDTNLPSDTLASLELCSYLKDNSDETNWIRSINPLNIVIDEKELIGTPGKPNSISCSNSDPYTYLWSTGDTTPFIYNLETGFYSVTITNDKNCTFKDTFEITEPFELTANAVSTDETYYNANDGTASSYPVGGTQHYTFTWSNGKNTQIISDLAPGYYLLTVTDANGCTALDTVTVKEFTCPNLEVNSEALNISCFDDCDGSIDISNVNNAVLPLSYKWNTGAASASLNNLCAADYSVTITDDKKCEVIQNYTLTQPDEITITIDSIRDVRLNPLGYIAIATNNNGNYIFSWIGPDNFTAKTEDLDNLKDFGCYTLTVTDTVTNCSIDSTICLEDKTATFDLEKQMNIQIFPNPANDILYIKYNIDNMNSKDIHINMFSITGTKVKSELQLDNKIDIKDLDEGIYLIRINTNDNSLLKKIVVIR